MGSEMALAVLVNVMNVRVLLSIRYASTRV